MKEIIKPGLILLVVTAIAGMLLGFVQSITAEPILAQEKKMLETAMREVLPKATEFTEVEAPGGDSGILKIYKSDAGYVFNVETKGYGGAIKMMVGISSDDDAVSGLRIIQHSETPGLGANATLPKFHEQYVGKATSELSVVKRAPDGQEIQAITSATITTRSVTGGVNQAIDWYKTNALQGGGK